MLKTVESGGVGGAYKPIRDVPLFRVSFFSIIPEPVMKIEEQFLNRL